MNKEEIKNWIDQNKEEWLSLVRRDTSLWELVRNWEEDDISLKAAEISIDTILEMRAERRGGS